MHENDSRLTSVFQAGERRGDRRTDSRQASRCDASFAVQHAFVPFAPFSDSDLVS
jgi:hypothetical protein